MRGAEVRTGEALLEAMGKALCAVSASDAARVLRVQRLPRDGSTVLTSALGPLQNNRVIGAHNTPRAGRPFAGGPGSYRAGAMGPGAPFVLYRTYFSLGQG